MPVILKNIFDRPTTLDETLHSEFSRFTENISKNISFQKVISMGMQHREIATKKHGRIRNTVCYEHSSKKLKIISRFLFICFNCYLDASRPSLTHCRGKNVTELILLSAFLSLSWTQRLKNYPQSSAQ